jgi:hypothetical protein
MKSDNLFTPLVRTRISRGGEPERSGEVMR